MDYIAVCRSRPEAWRQCPHNDLVNKLHNTGVCGRVARLQGGHNDILQQNFEKGERQQRALNEALHR